MVANTETHEETIIQEYTLRQYGNITHDLNSNDLKMIQTIKKLRTKYSDELSKRKHICVLNEPVQPIFDSKIKKTEKKNTPSCTSCTATKMNGDVCGAKLKSGNMFCLRHMPKK
jgi:ERCC4-type nuclease